MGAPPALFLDVAEAADLQRQQCELYGSRVIGRRQTGGDLVQYRLVVGDELPLGATFGGPPEKVERRAAQAAQAGKQPERRQHPGAVLPLLQMSGRRVTLGQQRRREMKAELVSAVELPGDAAQEIAVGIEPGNL